MSEENDQPTVEEPTEAPDNEDTTPDEPQEGADESVEFFKAKLDKANREARNLRARLKEYDPIVAAAKEAEEAQKSELQRANERAAQYEQELSTLKRERLVTDLASEAGLPKKLWRRVTGDNEDDIRADIEDLMDGLPKDTVSLSQKPRENLRGGTIPDEPVVESDPKKIVSSIPRTFQHR